LRIASGVEFEPAKKAGSPAGAARRSMAKKRQGQQAQRSKILPRKNPRP